MKNTFKFASLTPRIRHVLRNQGTDLPQFSKNFLPDTDGTFLCRGCGQALFRGSHQFQSSCGWPSFDDQIANALVIKGDQDGFREEICCRRCDSHLGHVFKGESLTTKNLRHCVNATAIEFVENTEVHESDEIIVAGGCFWAIGHFFSIVSELISRLETSHKQTVATNETNVFKK